ncbi:MAG TPA: thiamine pyrophosphate-binding protein [Thermoanaerobaculaceae bacterium]|nr:thiamine pyrophosphate-binding protein [Thermoanaerobaculaceae bacterium]
MSASRRLDALQGAGVELVAGVPCSYLVRFFAACEALPPGRYVAAPREDHAVAVCAGAWLGGRPSLAAMQNSGLGYCLEVLTSLHLMYHMPLPMLVSDRGEPTDYEEHRILGQRTRHLLDLFGIPWRVATAGDQEEEAEWLVRTANEGRLPAVLLVGKEADV